ncbi:MAG: sulfite oxidase heme-binding subunit YedZ [Gammaproteobacteria bacterium]
MRALAHPAAKPLALLLGLLPALWLFWAAATDQLGANPAEALIRSLGDWTLRALVLVLLITPLRVTAGWPVLARYRRMAGLFVFFYASLHWLAYAWLDMGFIWPDILADVPRRPFILVGTLTWLLLLALALTSFQRAVRLMGGARWQALHRSVYAVAALAVLHFYWMRAGKNDFAEVAVYAALLGGLLLWRLWYRRRRVMLSAR